jgi:hypothetical protein
MITSYVITQAAIYAIIVNGYLLILMITFSPRVWGYNDYPDSIKAKVPPQTPQEKRLAWIVAIPWFVFTLVYPVYSTYMLKAQLGGQIDFQTAFLNLLALTLLANLIDLVVLDWLIVSRITPRFVIMPGTEAQDYKDFSHHFTGQARASVVIVVLSAIIAAIVMVF